MQNQSGLVRATAFLLFFTLFIYGVIVARDFLYPIAFGFLLAYLLYPIANFLEMHRVPRILTILISIILAIVVIGGIFTFFYEQLTHLLDDFATLKRKALRNIESLQTSLQNLLNVEATQIESFLKRQISNFFDTGGAKIGELFSATTGTIFGIAILPVYIFLFLYYRTKFAYFILKMVPNKDKQTAINILRDISTIATNYMGGVAIVVLILCGLNSLGLTIIGVPYPLFFGIASAFFNFIPYFGTLMGGAVPLLFVLFTSATPGPDAIRVVILFMIIQFTENNILTPNIVGGNVKINPFFIIIGLVLGATIWGIPGMLVIVPTMAIVRIILSHTERYKPLAFLLGPGGTKKHSLTFGKIKHLFIRKKIKQKEDKPL